MSRSQEHDWCWDHLVPYIAGALDVDECRRLEAHVAQCNDCTQEFKDLSTLTSSMWDLFTDARPGEDLEERVIEHLRAAPAVRPAYCSSWARTMRPELPAVAASVPPPPPEDPPADAPQAERAAVRTRTGPSDAKRRKDMNSPPSRM